MPCCQQTTPFAAHLNAGMSIVFAVYVSASVSGGHLNPAVSIAFCVHKRMQWHYLPGYILAQCFGAFIGTALCYGLYDEIIADWERSVCLYRDSRHLALIIIIIIDRTRT